MPTDHVHSAAPSLTFLIHVSIVSLLHFWIILPAARFLLLSFHNNTSGSQCSPSAPPSPLSPRSKGGSPLSVSFAVPHCDPTRVLPLFPTVLAAKFYQITEKGLEEANLIQGKKPTSNIEVSFISYTNNDLPESNAYFDYDLKNNRFSFPLVHEFEETCGNGKMTSERIYYRFDGKHFVKEKKTKK